MVYESTGSRQQLHRHVAPPPSTAYLAATYNSSLPRESRHATSASPSMSQSIPERWSVNEVRRTFVDFFVKKKDHVFFPSSPVVPVNDPTLLFCNSGIPADQFNDI